MSGRRDVYVLVGHPERRRWEDARRFGFVSGGGGPAWSRRLRGLVPSDRVFVHLPTKAGGPAFAGIGVVTAAAVPAVEFEVAGRRLLDRDDLASTGLHLDAGDEERCEWLVAVHWHVAVEPAHGYWRPGLPRLQATNVMDLAGDVAAEIEAGLLR